MGFKWGWDVKGSMGDFRNSKKRLTYGFPTTTLGIPICRRSSEAIVVFASGLPYHHEFRQLEAGLDTPSK
jgi:hypothetical protein